MRKKERAVGSNKCYTINAKFITLIQNIVYWSANRMQTCFAWREIENNTRTEGNTEDFIYVSASWVLFTRPRNRLLTSPNSFESGFRSSALDIPIQHNLTRNLVSNVFSRCSYVHQRKSLQAEKLSPFTFPTFDQCLLFTASSALFTLPPNLMGGGVSIAKLLSPTTHVNSQKMQKEEIKLLEETAV